MINDLFENHHQNHWGALGTIGGNGRVNIIHVGLLLSCRAKILYSIAHFDYWPLAQASILDSIWWRYPYNLWLIYTTASGLGMGFAWYKSLFLPPKQDCVSFLLVDLDWIDIPYHCNYLIVRRDGKRSGTNQRMNESMINAKIEKWK